MSTKIDIGVVIVGRIEVLKTFKQQFKIICNKEILNESGDLLQLIWRNFIIYETHTDFYLKFTDCIRHLLDLEQQLEPLKTICTDLNISFKRLFLEPIDDSDNNISDDNGFDLDLKYGKKQIETNIHEYFNYSYQMNINKEYIKC